MRTARGVRVLMVVALGMTAAVSFSVAAAPDGFAIPPRVALTPNGAPARLAFRHGGKVGIASVMGLAGQQLTLSTRESSLGECDARLTLKSPDNTVLAGPTCVGRHGSVSVASLPVDGDYTASLAVTSPGMLWLSATSAAGPPSITPGADPLKVTWPHNTNEDLRLGFTSAANESYSIVATGGSTRNPCGLLVQFVDSGGNPVGATAAPCAAAGGFVDRTTMPSAGTYFVQLLGYDRKPLNVQLFKIVDQTGAIPTDGTPVAVDLATPGEDAQLTFAGTAGQRASVVLTSPASATTEILLVRPNGSPFRANQATGFLDAVTLDTTGTWTVRLDPSQSGAVTGTVQAYAFADAVGSADLSGTAQPVNLVPGQRASFAFNGTTGERVSAVLADAKTVYGACGPFDGPLTLVRPDGSVAVTGSCFSPDSFVDAFTLDATGTWNVVVDPQDAASGSTTLHTYDVVDQHGTIAIGGPAQPVSITVPGQNARFTFTATAAHQNVTVSLTDSTFPTCNLVLQSAGGATVAQAACALGSASVSARVPAGDYVAVFDPAGPDSGSATIQVTQP